MQRCFLFVGEKHKRNGCAHLDRIKNRGLKSEDQEEFFILALTGEPFHQNPFAVLCNTCTRKAASRAPFSRKAGSDSRRVSCNFPLPEMKRKYPPPPPRPIPSSKRKEGNGERNGLIKRKEGEDYEEDWETRGEREDKSAIGELPFF